MSSLLFSVLCLICFSAPDGLAQAKCIHAVGEALIVNNDKPSAKMEAVARAKWTAIENVAGTEVKAGSLVQNFTLVEDVMKTKAGGVVKSYQVIDEFVKDDVLNVKINACVEPSQARDAVSQLGLNNSIALFIPARKPGRHGDEFEEKNILSETLIGKLTEQGFTVVDVAPTHAVNARDVESAVRTGRTLSLRSLMYKFLSNLIIIGKVDYTISTKKGEDIGYGLSMPFNHVTVRLNYRILSKNNKTGNMEILTTGVEQARALANSVEDAAAQAMQELAESLTPSLLDKVGQYIQGNTKKIAVQVAGVKDLDTVLEVKGILQNIVWVAGVEEKEMGSFVVSYPENTLYLANSIQQKGSFKIVNFSPYSLTLEYLK
ncbi:MAG TPA: flagellar assembly protein T N-terminal domain-containing protein [Smithellaceae bacterium]|nr:flagellar assembly protein T N-terminal domain-containing protein [Smithellaceae bacterium]HRV45443.1 flagellar assembly protein T N-terminal domain-containing protein [Smithellaceae bacterium]